MDLTIRLACDDCANKITLYLYPDGELSSEITIEGVPIASILNTALALENDQHSFAFASYHYLVFVHKIENSQLGIMAHSKTTDIQYSIIVPLGDWRIFLDDIQWLSDRYEAH